MIEDLITWAPDFTICDEAHRVKNINSKRTKSVFKLANISPYFLLLSGTPIRNHPSEAGTLLSILDDQARDQIGVVCETRTGATVKRKVNENLVKEFLGVLMIRRTKQQVLSQLPPKIREWVQILPETDHPEVETAMVSYHDGIEVAKYAYHEAIKAGRTDGEARNAMRGGIETARIAVGRIKIADGQVAAMIHSIVEAKGSCIVFSAHHIVTDTLAYQLTKNKCCVVTVDGRTSIVQRAEAEKAFQEGEVDVFIGGINAAGESITLTRAETCVFVESDWVPAAMMQAEDRGHRIGQEGNGYHIIHVLLSADTGVSLDHEMKTLLERKIETVDRVLDETTDFDFSARDGQGSLITAVIDSILGARVRNKNAGKVQRGRPRHSDERIKRRAQSRHRYH